VWGFGRVAKRQEMFFFFSLLTGKETRNQTELEHETTKKKKIRNGAVLIVVEWGCKSKKWEESNVCTETLDCAT
jgi:hypothetical protein